VSSNGGSIPFDVVFTQVCQQSSPTTDELQQATTGVMILPVQAKMGCETIDALGKERDLDLWRTCIRVMDTSRGNDVVFLYSLQRHAGGASSGLFKAVL
jgi:hypothetical protein